MITCFVNLGVFLALIGLALAADFILRWPLPELKSSEGPRLDFKLENSSIVLLGAIQYVRKERNYLHSTRPTPPFYLCLMAVLLLNLLAVLVVTEARLLL
jgi:hypothetical protein